MRDGILPHVRNHIHIYISLGKRKLQEIEIIKTHRKG